MIFVLLFLAGAAALDALSKLVAASQKLLVNASVLATGQFFERAHERHRQSKTRLVLRMAHLSVSRANASFVCEATRGPTVDWIVFAANEFFNADTATTVALLQACGSLTHYGVLLWTQHPGDARRVRHETDFVYVDDQSALIGNSARVYNRRHLIRLPPLETYPFQSLSDLDIPWSDTAQLGKTRFRAYTPASLSQALAASDIVIAVNSAAEFREQRDAVRRTWAAPTVMAHMQFCVFFVVASPSVALMQEAEQHGDIMVFEASEGYNGTWSVLPLKGNGARQIALRYATDAAWFFRCDDDTFVHTANLFRLLNGAARRTYNSSHIYVGCAFDSAPLRDADGSRAKWNVTPDVYRPHRYPRFMSGGAGYALSRAAAVCLAQAVTQPDWRFYDREDVLVRLTLADYCGPVIVHSHCDVFRPQFAPAVEQTIVTVHYARPPERLQALYEQTHKRQD